MRAVTHCRTMPSANASPTVALVLMMRSGYYSQWVKMYKHFGDYQEYQQSGEPLEIQRWPGLQKWLTRQKREHQKKLEGSPTTLTDAMEYSMFRLGIITYLTRAVQVQLSDGSIHEERIRLLVDYGKFSTSLHQNGGIFCSTRSLLTKKIMAISSWNRPITRPSTFG